MDKALEVIKILMGSNFKKAPTFAQKATFFSREDLVSLI